MPNDEPLSRIGTRGVVLHDGDPLGGEYSYFSDNDRASWRTHEITAELQSWLSARDINPVDLEALERLKVATAFLPGTQKTLFLNLDAFGDLKKDDNLLPNTSGPVPPAEAVLIRETQSSIVHYYAIARAEFGKIEVIDAGEAKIVVKRGAIAAAIPNNTIPYGTNCVLVNLTQLLPPK